MLWTACLSVINAKEWEWFTLVLKTKRKITYTEPSKSTWLAWQPLQNKSFCFKLYPAKNFMVVLSTVCAVIDSTQSMVWTCCTDHTSFAGLRPKHGFWCTNIPHWLISSEMFHYFITGFIISLGYIAIWALLAQHRGSFTHRQNNPGNHWDGMRLLCSLSALFPSPDIQDDSWSGKLFSTHSPRKRFIIP